MYLNSCEIGKTIIKLLDVLRNNQRPLSLKIYSAIETTQFPQESQRT